MINLDQCNDFDRVDHNFPEAVYSFVPGCLLHATPGAMAEANGVRSKLFIFSRSTCQNYPHLRLFYVLAREPFLCSLRANLVLGGIKLPGTTI